MKEFTLNMHIHSVYSDGIKTPPEIAEIAARYGIDVIITTDHNVFPEGFEGYYTFENKQVMVLTGEEIHDQKRDPQKNHMLAIGIDKDFSRLAQNPQELIDELNQAGALSFIAHAYDPAMPFLGEPNLSWVDWSIQGFTGLELWNNLSELKVRTKSTIQAVFYVFFPNFMALEPPRQIRAIWDSLLTKGEKVVAIGGADAHNLIYHVGPFSKEIFTYSYHFQTVNNHVLTNTDFSGGFEIDKKNILDAMHKGHLFVANDMVKAATGFRCNLKAGNEIHQMGSQTPFKPGQEIIAELPYPAECRLIHNGLLIDQRKAERRYTWDVTESGVYRLECYRRYLGRQRGWIFSNPFYITDN